mmetsp:Transcript_4612/g.9931  ORF Transcript_4612/g.9931 Transcript_4612/m.9931 type:complete len:227 (+) Transcript_4612:134-814(+)
MRPHIQLGQLLLRPRPRGKHSKRQARRGPHPGLAQSPQPPNRRARGMYQHGDVPACRTRRTNRQAYQPGPLRRLRRFQRRGVRLRIQRKPDRRRRVLRLRDVRKEGHQVRHTQRDGPGREPGPHGHGPVRQVHARGRRVDEPGLRREIRNRVQVRHRKPAGFLERRHRPADTRRGRLHGRHRRRHHPILQRDQVRRARRRGPRRGRPCRPFRGARAAMAGHSRGLR